MCAPVTLRRFGAYLPRVRAPPEPAKLWHMAQLTRNSSPPLAMSPPSPEVMAASGMAGPGASDATYAASCLVCSSLNLFFLRMAWTPGLASGMRPVPTWKSTAAAPTPARLGPAAPPWALAPWQVAQLARKSFLPALMSSADAEAACAGRGATRA